MGTSKKGKIIFDSDTSIVFASAEEAKASLKRLPDDMYSGVLTVSSVSGSVMFDQISNKNLLKVVEKYLEK